MIRRAYLDLIGLLPPPEEVEAFVKDPAPDAYSKLVDKLLASPNYGERWGRNWLDVVRYADSSGFEFDITVENAWRYRDYVIKAFNEDKPYNQFIVEQLAGDELDKPTYDSLTATTYYRVGPRVRFREANYPSYRYDYMDDMVRTTFQGFHGPLRQLRPLPRPQIRSHHAPGLLQGRLRLSGVMSITTSRWFRRIKSTRTNAKVKAVADEMTPMHARRSHGIEKPYQEKRREQQVQDALKKFPPDIQEAIKTAPEKRTEGQKLLVAQVIITGDDVDPDNLVADANASAKAKAAAKANQVFGAGSEYNRRALKLSPEDETKRAELQAKIAAHRREAAGSAAHRRRCARRRLPACSLTGSAIHTSREPDVRITD